MIKSLANSFDKNAAEYRQFRPEYPVSLSKEIVRALGLSKGCRILEIGCGAGQATGLFSDLEPVQVSIDPGSNLLDECRALHGDKPGYSFECCTFEDYEDDPASFDLIYAATSFHWLERGLRFKRAARFLNKRGGLAVFSDRHTKGIEGFFIEVQELYTKFAPQLIPGNTMEPQGDSCEEKNPLSLIHEAKYDRDITYNSDDYIGLLKTFSGHIALGEARLNNLCEGIRPLIDTKYKGQIIKTLTTSLSIYINKGMGQALHFYIK